MKCNEFEIQLDAVLDERLPPENDPQLVVHARECAACAELLTATGEVLEGVRGLSVPELDGTLSRRVLEELKREKVGSAPHYVLYAAALVATAAALLLAAFVLPGAPENNVAVEQPRERAPAEVEVAMAEPVELDRQVVLKLIKDTRRNVDQIPSLITGGSAQSPSAELEATNETSSEVASTEGSPADGAPVNGKRDGLDEIAESVVGSFGFLLDVLEETDRRPNS